MDQDLHLYSKEKIVESYANRKALQPPEQTIYDLLESDLGKMRMLDIGVGAGRTSYYFAGKTKTYLGIDYSDKMISSCRQKFKEQKGILEFKTLDMRKLKKFHDNSFDLVLISFNGIDHLEHNERINTMNEIKRLLSPGAWFCFSTHNLHSLKELYKFELRWNVFAMMKNFYSFCRFRMSNSVSELMAISDYSIINDGAHDFSLKICYVNPMQQLDQLRSLGYRNISVYGLRNGKKISSEEELRTNKDFHLYYLCQK